MEKKKGSYFFGEFNFAMKKVYFLRKLYSILKLL